MNATFEKHLSGAMKDTYIQLLEQGYSPEDIKKWMESPDKTQEPNPKASVTASAFNAFKEKANKILAENLKNYDLPKGEIKPEKEETQPANESGQDNVKEINKISKAKIHIKALCDKMIADTVADSEYKTALLKLVSTKTASVKAFAKNLATLIKSSEMESQDDKVIVSSLKKIYASLISPVTAQNWDADPSFKEDPEQFKVEEEAAKDKPCAIKETAELSVEDVNDLNEEFDLV